MGRTIQSATQTWIEEEKALQRFTRALRREDQAVMKDLILLIIYSDITPKGSLFDTGFQQRHSICRSTRDNIYCI